LLTLVFFLILKIRINFIFKEKIL